MNGVHDTAEIPDVDEPSAHSRRRLANGIPGGVLPFQLAGLEIDREEVPVPGADVHDAVRDRGGRLDRLAGLIGPFERERLRHVGRRDAGQMAVASKLRPFAWLRGDQANQGYEGN